MTAPIAQLGIRLEPHYRRAAFETGLKRLGYSLEPVNHRKPPRGLDDLLVLWNLKRGPDESMARRWELAGGTVLVCENGYLQQVDKTRYAISTHGHNGSGWFPVGDDDRFTPLGFEFKAWRSADKGYILVRDQRSIGSELMHSPRGWGPLMVDKLRKANPGVEIRLMLHPGDSGKLEADAKAIAGARLVHVWASALGVRALVEGVQVQHHAPHWICEHWRRDGREAALQRMAHGQWHHEEIATGEPFARMKAAGWGPTW